MRFLTIYRPAPAPSKDGSSGPSYDAMRQYSEEQTRAGVLVSQAMLDSAITEVRFDGADFGVTEVSDPAAGYAFIEAPSREAAVAGVKEFLKVAGAGTTQIRQVIS